MVVGEQAQLTGEDVKFFFAMLLALGHLTLLHHLIPSSYFYMT